MPFFKAILQSLLSVDSAKNIGFDFKNNLPDFAVLVLMGPNGHQNKAIKITDVICLTFEYKEIFSHASRDKICSADRVFNFCFIYVKYH